MFYSNFLIWREKKVKTYRYVGMKRPGDIGNIQQIVLAEVDRQTLDGDHWGGFCQNIGL